jgi:hypothetical protein
VGATTDIYVGLGLVVLMLAFALALVRTASHSDDSSELLFAEYLRERARAFEALASMTIEARRVQTREIATRLSHRRTWRQPSSV